jgi:hypothetical protein
VIKYLLFCVSICAGVVYDARSTAMRGTGGRQTDRKLNIYIYIYIYIGSGGFQTDRKLTGMNREDGDYYSSSRFHV